MTSEERAAKNRERVRAWKAANPDKVREQHKRYHLKHIEQRHAYNRHYYQTMRKKAKQYDELTGGTEK